MRQPRREEVRAGAACPQCDAAVGVACLGKAGQERVSNHAKRTAAFLDSLEPQTVEEATPERLDVLQSMPYGEYLLTPEWRARRADAIYRAGGMCQLCSSRLRLHCHHRTYARRGNELPYDLTVLCEECHALFHEHRELQHPGGTVSYGAFVHAAVEERQRATVGRVVRIGSDEWRFQAVKYANDNFQDFPEYAVVDALKVQRWPDRPVGVREILRTLRLLGFYSDRGRHDDY